MQTSPEKFPSEAFTHENYALSWLIYAISGLGLGLLSAL